MPGLTCPICGERKALSLTRHLTSKHGLSGDDIRKKKIKTRHPKRYEVVKAACKAVKARSYLEIGVRAGDTFKRIGLGRKVAVDPDPGSAATVFKTSDDFFRDYGGESFDVIFVDGLHHKDFVYRDIMNSIKNLNPGGIIIVDDCCPWHPSAAVVPRKGDGVWVGDVWQGWLKAREELSGMGYRTFTVEAAMGMGVVFAGDPLPTYGVPDGDGFFLEKGKYLALVDFKTYLQEIKNA